MFRLSILVQLKQCTSNAQSSCCYLDFTAPMRPSYYLAPGSRHCGELNLCYMPPSDSNIGTSHATAPQILLVTSTLLSEST